MTSSRSSSPGSSRTDRPGRSCPTWPSRGRSIQTGATWTFELRDDAALARRRAGHRRGRRVHHPDPPGPRLHGPGAGSWKDVTVEATAVRERSCSPWPPRSAASSRRRPSRSPRRTCWRAFRSTRWPTTRSGSDPIGSGPFALVRLDADIAELVPAADRAAADDGDPDASPARPSTRWPRPPRRPARPVAMPYLAGIEFRFFDDADVAGRRLPRRRPRRRLRPAAGRGRGAGRDAGQPDAALSGLDPDGRPAQPAARTATSSPTPAIADRAPRGDRSARPHRRGVRRRSPGAANGPIPPTSPLFDPGAAGPVALRAADAAQKALKAAGWTKVDNAWRRPSDKKPLTFELLSPDADVQPGGLRGGRGRGAPTGSASASRSPTCRCRRASSSRAGWPSADFKAAVADVTIGLDPDLYPLLASSQTLTGGSNVIGLQDPALDKLLVAARKPGSAADRTAAYAALQDAAGEGQYLLPLAFADESIVVRDTVAGPAAPAGRRPGRIDFGMC